VNGDHAGAEQRIARVPTSDVLNADILEMLTDAVLILDSQGRIAYGNGAAVRLVACAAGGLSAIDSHSLFMESLPRSTNGDHDAAHFLDQVLHNGLDLENCEAILTNCDGIVYQVALSARRILDDTGAVTGVAIAFHDITERKRAQLQYTVHEQVLELISRGDGIVEVGRLLVEFVERAIPRARTALFLLNHETERIELAAAQNLPRPLQRSLDGVSSQVPCSDWYEALARGEPIFLDLADVSALPEPARLGAEGYGIRSCWAYPIVASTGGLLGVLCVYREASGRPAPEDEKIIDSAIGLGRLVVDRLQFERDLAQQTFNDKLTGLPNRVLLMDRLHGALQRSARSDDHVALMLLDLDQFQMINDSLGHTAGDQLLRKAAQRLTGCLRADDLVARFAGDEFGILLEQISCESDAINVVMRIQRAFATPITIEGVDIYASFSVGIALADETRLDADALVRFADIALHRAKERGHGQFAVFSPSQDLSRVPKIELQSRLHRALASNSLEIHFQPIRCLRTDQNSGYEALVRWNDERFGEIAPVEFLPLAQRSGIMSEITAWVLDRAAAQLTEWQRKHSSPLVMSVNVSSDELSDSLLVEQVEAVIRRYRLPERSLVLELTEHAIVDLNGQTVEVLDRLRRLGVCIALDDFGTGYSSLSYLEQFPVDGIKIDRMFIKAARGGVSQAPVAMAMVSLARTLGMVSVAEGIETAEDDRAARRLGCDFGQGYYYGRPHPGSIR
jgi:diguanylate cyclase (GGDEF)-like protein